MGIKMEGLYKISGIRCQVYFNHKKRLEKVSYIEMRTLETVRQVRLRHPSIGARPLYYILRPQMGINKFEDLISDSGLGIRTKNKWIKTTDSNHPYRKYSNLTHGNNGEQYRLFMGYPYHLLAGKRYGLLPDLYHGCLQSKNNRSFSL